MSAKNGKQPQNTPPARGPDGKWQKGVSPNPGGRPKNKVSITYWLEQFAGMTGAEAAEACAVYSAQFKKVKGPLPLGAIIAARAILELMNEPGAALFGQVLDRIDGKVAQKIEVDSEIAQEMRAMTPEQRSAFVEWLNRGGLQADAVAWLASAGVSAEVAE